MIEANRKAELRKAEKIRLEAFFAAQEQEQDQLRRVRASSAPPLAGVAFAGTVTPDLGRSGPAPRSS
jgi:hypothetical protein